jgi:hypothetical protein
MRVLIEKLTAPQPVQKLLAFYGTRTFIAAFTKALPFVPVLCHSKTVNAPILSLENPFYTILPSTARSSKLYRPENFFRKTLCTLHPPPNACHIPCPSHSFWFCHSNNPWWGVQIMHLLILCSFIQSPDPLSLLGPAHSKTLFSLCFSLNVTDQVSHPYNTGKNFLLGTQNNHCHERCPAYDGC